MTPSSASCAKKDAVFVVCIDAKNNNHLQYANLKAMFRKHSLFMRFGLLLALFAWLMQATVLLAPLFGDVSLGHGVCIELADVVNAAPDKPYKMTTSAVKSTTTYHHHMGMSGMMQGDMAMPISSAKVSSTIPTSAEESAPAIHQHADCSICLVMGHVSTNFNTITSIVTLQALIIIQTKPSVVRNFNIAYNRTLRPQAHAPPLA